MHTNVLIRVLVLYDPNMRFMSVSAAIFSFWKTKRSNLR